MLSDLNWLLLKDHRKYIRLVLLYQIIQGKLLAMMVYGGSWAEFIRAWYDILILRCQVPIFDKLIVIIIKAVDIDKIFRML